MIFTLIGSLGLFLLGMWLMTEGLKLAGGRALERLLSQWTSTRGRGLASGILITSLVQSSSAVTVATMGFVSAGLMSFQQAIWVVFGSNVGTTFTAWIITFFGFSVKIDAFTFPLIGIGAALRIFFPYERGKALGMALAGFGLLFMGIDALKVNFSDFSNQLDIASIFSSTGYETLMALGVGFLLTLLTQSSSAGIAIILTAVASGVVGMEVAAAAVIGANIGTTSTAIIAGIGGNAHVKRLAWAHVVFNLLTALVAISLLPVFWPVVTWIGNLIHVGENPVMLLAIFHTFFNVLGVILMWPVEPKLTQFLLKCYSKPEKQKPQHARLDTNLATIPDLAIRVMTIELDALIEAIGDMTLPARGTKNASINNSSSIKERLHDLNDFIALALKSNLTKDQGEQLTLGLSVSHYLHNACATYTEALARYQGISAESGIIPSPLYNWFDIVNTFNHLIHHSDSTLQHEQLAQLAENYKETKRQLLSAVVGERLNIDTVDTALQIASLSRRFIEQILQSNDAYYSLSHPVIEEKPMVEANIEESEPSTEIMAENIEEELTHK